MHYYIDGYNWLFQTVTPSSILENKRREFIEAINILTKNLACDVTIVFDSCDPTRDIYSRNHYKDIEIIYTPKGQSADNYIVEAVSSNAGQKAISVVTLDRNLQDKCRAAGATIVTMKEFYGICCKKRSKKIKQAKLQSFTESPQQIARLMQIFEKRLLDHPQEDRSF